jgi:hypothetical protein
MTAPNGPASTPKCANPLKTVNFAIHSRCSNLVVQVVQKAMPLHGSFLAVVELTIKKQIDSRSVILRAR